MKPLKRSSTLITPFLNVMFLLLIALAGSFISKEEMALIDAGLYRKIVMLAILGISMAIAYSQYRLRRYLTRCPPEIYLYMTWLLWCVIGAQDITSNPLSPHGFWGEYRIVVVTGALFCATAIFIYNTQQILLLFTGFIVGSLLVLCDTILSGDFHLTALLSQADVNIGDNTSRLGHTGGGDANIFSYLLLFGIFGCSYFLISSKRLLTRFTMVSFITLLGIAILQTASRQITLGVVLFGVLTFLVCCRAQWLIQPTNVVLVVISLVIMSYMGSLVVENTYLGQRLFPSSENADYMYRTNMDRLDVYLQAWDILSISPLEGVGLGSLTKYSYDARASHSDYISILCETGIVGFAIYFSVYAIILYRLFNVNRYLKPGMPNKIAVQLLLSVVVTVLILALFRWNYSTPVHYAMLGGAAGFSYSLQHCPG